MGWNISSDDKGIKVNVKAGVSKAGNAYKLYSTAISSKKQDGNWANVWVDLRFKKAMTEEKKFYNKGIIKIKSAFPTANEYNGSTTLSIFVMDYDVIEEGEKPEEGISASKDFIQVAESVELPFS